MSSKWEQVYPVNVIDKEVITDAKVMPEEHQGLAVRAAGYSAYFTRLLVSI